GTCQDCRADRRRSSSESAPHWLYYGCSYRISCRHYSASCPAWTRYATLRATTHVHQIRCANGSYKRLNQPRQLLTSPGKGSEMLCIICGNQLPEDAQICLQCGEDVSTPNDIAYPEKNGKRVRKGVIALIAILSACACILVAFVVLRERLKVQSQRPTLVTGAPLVYSSRLPTPT